MKTDNPYVLKIFEEEEE